MKQENKNKAERSKCVTKNVWERTYVIYKHFVANIST